LGIYRKAVETIFGYTVDKTVLSYLFLENRIDVPPVSELEMKLNSLVSGILSEDFPLMRSQECSFCPFSGVCSGVPPATPDLIKT
jgi:CRISPR/Cas system-associated exonuclease Cas4 (RecB family)